MTSLSHLCSDGFIELINRHEWEQGQVEMQRHPETAQGSAIVRGFLGSNNANNNDCRITPMHVACAERAPLHFLERLYELNRHSLSTKDSVYKRLPLHVALISSMHPETVMKLIEWNPSSAQGQDILGRYPLHYACNHGANAEEVELLVSAFPEAVTKADSNGWLPIHVACRFDMPLAVIQVLLLLYPCSIHRKTSKGSTPLTYARRTKNQPLISYLQSVTKTVTADASMCSNNQDDNPTIHRDKAGIEILHPLPTPEFFELQTQVQITLTEVFRPRVTGSASSTTSSLTSSPTAATGNSSSRRTIRILDKDELARLAFTTTSSYMSSRRDKFVQMPFLGEKIDLDLDDS